MSRKTTSSRLRHRLTLQEEVMVPDEGGGYIRSWSDVTNIWAEIIPISGRERFFAGKLQAEVTHRILMRYHSDITTAHRLVFENRIFNIRAVIYPQNQKNILEILVEEGVAT